MTSSAHGRNMAGTNSFSYTSAALPVTCHCACRLMASLLCLLARHPGLDWRCSDSLFKLGNPIRDTPVHCAPDQVCFDFPLLLSRLEVPPHGSSTGPRPSEEGARSARSRSGPRLDNRQDCIGLRRRPPHPAKTFPSLHRPNADGL